LKKKKKKIIFLTNTNSLV